MTTEEFAKFIEANKEAIYADAESHTKRNAKGETVITRDDPWYYEDCWDEDYKELIAREESVDAAAH